MQAKKSQSMKNGLALKWKDRIALFFIPLITRIVLSTFSLTWKRKDCGAEHLEHFKKNGKPWILAFWHTNVTANPFFFRNLNMAALISQSNDGEIIARVAKIFGNTAIRGSSTRGGSAALKQMIRHLRAGHPAVFTPDGPRGPAFQLQSGVIAAAQASQVPILPVHWEASPQWIFQKSWDQHRFPKFFSRIYMHFARPIHIPRHMTEEEFENMRLHVEKVMLDNIENCRKWMKEEENRLK